MCTTSRTFRRESYVLAIEDLPDDFELSDAQKNQVHATNTKQVMIDKDAIENFTEMPRAKQSARSITEISHSVIAASPMLPQRRWPSAPVKAEITTS